MVTIKEDAVVYEAGSDARLGEPRQSPFAGDPVTAHRFLQAMYQIYSDI